MISKLCYAPYQLLSSEYIDQPIGTGFSFGNDTVNSTISAAPFVWQAFQVLFESPQFQKFQRREFNFCHGKLRRALWPGLSSLSSTSKTSLLRTSIKGSENYGQCFDDQQVGSRSIALLRPAHICTAVDGMIPHPERSICDLCDKRARLRATSK